MFGIGLPELIFIFILALIVLGPEKLPEVAKQLAKLVVDVKKAANEFQKQLELDDEEQDLLKLTEVKQEDFINPRGLIKEDINSNNVTNDVTYEDDWEKELPKTPEEAKLRSYSNTDNLMEHSLTKDNNQNVSINKDDNLSEKNMTYEDLEKELPKTPQEAKLRSSSATENPVKNPFIESNNQNSSISNDNNNDNLSEKNKSQDV